MTIFRAAAATDAGRVRQVNQDVAFASETLVAVADGMGGHAAGDVAARIAIESLEHAVEPARGPQSLVDGVTAANRAVFEEAESHPEMRGMGTTLTAAALVEGERGVEICLVNVGDSRAYLLEDGQLSRLTEDHSLVEQLVRQGELTEEEALVHPHRHILTRALGIDPELEVDSWIFAPLPSMRLLLCSDGLTNECTEEEITAVLLDYDRPEDAAASLVERALAHGGSDNITAVVVDVEPDVPKSEATGANPAATVVEDEGATAGSASTVVAAATTVVDPDPLVFDPPRRSRRQQPAVRAQESTRPEPVARRTRSSSEMPRRPAERLVTGRAVAFIIVFLGILGGIAGFTYWFDRATYFVGIDHGNVAIFEGRPNGMLWFQPTLLTQTTTPISKIVDADLPLLQAGILEGSYDDAVTTANNLADEKNLLGIGIPHPTTTTTTTTVPVTTTTATTTTTTPKKAKG